jgi:N-acetylmuramoyl-L-alanine amidase
MTGLLNRNYARPWAILMLSAATVFTLAHVALFTIRPVPITQAAPRPLAGVTVNIDPGHNGKNAQYPNQINRLVNAGPIRKPCNTTGTTTRGGVSESSINFALSLKLKRQLEKRGATVIMTRYNDRGWGPCINDRARIGNRADLSISVHGDGNLKSGARGFHVIHPLSIRGYTDDISAESLRLAMQIRAAMDQTAIPRSNYVGRSGLSRRGDLGGLNLSNVPAVFLEAGNLRNKRDAKLLTSSSEQDRIAAQLAAGIARYVATASTGS